MRIKLAYPEASERQQEVLIEQTEYLLGVLYADPEHRKDGDLDRNIGDEIDAHGTGTAAFWRGVLETAGRLALYPKKPRENEPRYPRIELEGSYRFLRKFLDFLEESCAPQCGLMFSGGAKF